MANKIKVKDWRGERFSVSDEQLLSAVHEDLKRQKEQDEQKEAIGQMTDQELTDVFFLNG